MTREGFEKRLLDNVRAQKKRCPDMEMQDAVKKIFQGMLGPGHLLSDRETVAGRIAQETNDLPPDPARPLFEPLSPAWCTLDLRRAAAEGIAPDLIAGMMRSSNGGARFTRADVRELIDRPEIREEFGIPSGYGDRIAEEGFLPSHSEGFKKKHAPAYRVVDAAWMGCEAALSAIAGGMRERDRLLITLDGPCAGGKTTLAQRLSEVLRAETVHTDDFVIPHGMKTPERLSRPGGNCDAERLAEEVIRPWKTAGHAFLRRYDCRGDRMLPPEVLPDTRVLILEGSYCNLPAIREYADVRLFLDTPWNVREQRLRKRETPSSLERFYRQWIPLENAYFEAFGLPDGDCIPIRPDAEP